MRNKTIHNFDISVVIPMRNASSTILETLKSIQKQIYPIQDVIIVDNASTDNSVNLVKAFSKKNKKMHIQLLLNKKDLMIARSLSRGVQAAKTQYIILMHADCRLVSQNEFATLVRPLSQPSVVATYGQTNQPLSIWEKYAFWEQFLFAHQAGKTMPGLVGKIDCIKKDAYLKVGGHDTVGHDNYGGEDADLHMRLRSIGKTVATKATIEHLHYMYKDFSFADLLDKKKQTAGAYGILLRKHGLRNGWLGILTMLLKPFLAFGLLIPYTSITTLAIVMLYIALYYRRMFLSLSIAKNPRIMLIPLVFIFLIYFETFYTLLAFFKVGHNLAE